MTRRGAVRALLSRVTMERDELIAIVKAAGGGENALAYTDDLLAKVNGLEAAEAYDKLLKQFGTAKEEGDFRGRVLEVNFAYAFLRHGITLDQAVKQGMKGDIDFRWNLADHAVYFE